jgi:membrane fusion protein, multidrug efflux system
MTAARRLLTFVLTVVAVAAASWFGWWSWDTHTDRQTTDDAYVRSEVVTISPRVAGYTIAILADDDEPVTAGEVVVRIDPRDDDAAVKRAVAAQEQAAAVLVQSKAKLDLQTSQIEIAEAALNSAEAQSQNADLALNRAGELLGKGSGTQVTFDQATTNAVTQRSAVTQARAQLDFERQQIGVLKADIRVSEAKLADANQAVVTASLALEDTEVWTPVKATVANRRTRVGEYVVVGTRMLSIVPSEGLWIEANFRVTQLARMKPDQPVAITLDTYQDQRICGYIEAIGEASGSEFALVPPDNATRNFTKIVRRFPVRIRVNRRDPHIGLLKSGMSTSVSVSVDGKAASGCQFDPGKKVSKKIQRGREM